jgi:hypothetical protein
LKNKSIVSLIFGTGAVLLLLLNFFSCKADGEGGEEEGIIEFNTFALDETHPLYGFAPASAALKFKKEKFVIEMSTMGMFNTSIIGDNKAKTLAQTIKFMNFKQACIENEKDLMVENLEYELKIEETKETKEIIGLKAHKIIVTKVKEPNVVFDAWYTKELGMENCNALTPYAKVKGVLLDYRIKKMGMEMHFQAKSYQNCIVPDNAFDIPASMKIVSKEEMEKFFQELQ